MKISTHLRNLSYLSTFTTHDLKTSTLICILTWTRSNITNWSRSIETNGRFVAEKTPTSVGPPSGGRAAFLSLLHPLYSTRPYGLVQAIFWHTCPDLDLGP